MEINEEKENRELLTLFRKLMRAAKPRLKENDEATIKKAFKFAVDAHKDMRRRSGEPYIFHPMHVALIVAEEMELDATSMVAAFLHDVVEDTSFTLEDIEASFGPKVSYIIDGLTKMKASEKMSLSSSMQAENFRKMLLTISSDIRVVLIKIADRLHNMRTLDSMPRDKKLRIRSETSYIYAPLAHRLGLYNIKSELEDLGLKYSDPEAYASISEKINASKPDRARFFRVFVRPIRMEMKRSKLDYAIKMRMKSIYSIYRKMQTQEIPFEQVYDFFAIRVIVKGDVKDERRACWEVYSIITDIYTPSPNRLRDWISVPRENGYESLHVTVMGSNGHWVEVQIRTERMDEVAEKGFAAHWKYKDSSKGAKKRKQAESGLEDWIGRIRELLENKEINALDFVESFRSTLYQDEVYVFTPKGDLKRLQQGASVLDFAFEIHTEIGVRCLGAKVNGKLVALHYKLQNGDQIEILTSNHPKISSGWEKFVVTSKARAKIREYINEDRRKLAQAGKEIVERKFNHMKEPFNERNISRISNFFGFNNETDFFQKVGSGEIDHTEIKKFKEHLETLTASKKIHLESAKDFKRNIKEIKPEQEDELVIGEHHHLFDYSMAPCCNPIQGEDVFGFISISNGIRVHRSTCPNGVALMSKYGHRVIKARWASDTSKEYEVNLIIEGTDRTGLVLDVTRVISQQMKVNIKTINIGSDVGIFRGNIALSVHSKKELENIIKEIEGIEGVLNIIREEVRV